MARHTIDSFVDFEKLKRVFSLHCCTKLRSTNTYYGEYRLHVCYDIADDSIIHRVSQHFSVGSARNILKSVSAFQIRFIFLSFSTFCYAVYPVEEEEDSKIPGENGEHITVPVNMVHANPNGVEFDNLYLDMNGIVGFSSIITFQSILCFSYRFTHVRTLRARFVHNISLAKICYL